MYEPLTEFITNLEVENPGGWVFDRENDGTPEHPIRVPWVNYEKTVLDLETELMSFVDTHEDMGLTAYSDILEQHGIKWEKKSMSSADVSELDAVTVLALLVGAFRAERFCDGVLLSFCKSGCIVKWLRRLEEIDEED